MHSRLEKKEMRQTKKSLPIKRRGLGGTNQGGFSLLEAMIAMVILTIGLLGLAGMQTMAMLYNVDAEELTQATNMAAEMIDRIQLNSQNADSYDGIDTTQIIDNLICPNAPAGTQDIALGDCLQWQTGLNDSGLDNPQGTVVVAAVGPPGLNQMQVDINVNWTTKGAENKVARPASINFGTIVTPP